VDCNRVTNRRAVACRTGSTTTMLGLACKASVEFVSSQGKILPRIGGLRGRGQ
jgi:hypothetical protein